MKIAVLVNTLFTKRGMDSVAALQAQELKKNGHDVTIFTFDSDITLQDIPIVKIGWPEQGIINLVYRIMFLIDIPLLTKYMSILKDYDLVICHFYPMTYLGFLVKLRNPSIKYFYYNHGIANLKFEKKIVNRLFESFIILITWISTYNADCIISISKYIDSGIKHKRVTRKILYNKVNINKFAKTGEINADLRKKIDGRSPLFLYVGVLTDYKGIEALIQSFKIVHERYPTAGLMLVGNISYGFNLNRYVDKSIENNLLYFGEVQDNELVYIYNKCDVYVTASRWEGFNLPLAEAQLLGKPVVAYDTGPHGEIVSNGKTGILVKPFDEEEFGSAMIEAYQNKDILGECASKWAKRFMQDYEDVESINSIVKELVKK